MDDRSIRMLPRRISGMQKLEALFKQNGYLICQASGTKIFDFDKVVACFIPLDSSTDQIMAVHSELATAFLQKAISNQFNSYD